MSLFTLGSLLGWATVVAIVAARFGPRRATFIGIVLGVHTAIAVALAPWARWAAPVFWYGQVAVFVHFLSLSRRRMPSMAYRSLVGVPASWFSAATMLALPWGLVAAVGVRPPVVWLPYLLTLVGLVDSLVGRNEVVDITLGEGTTAGDGLRRARSGRGPKVERPLNIVQITDPHLGTFMSEARLRRLCEQAVAKAPDLVLLTGDFMTIESQHDPELLARALAPLRALEGRTFACLGNHDHEAPDVIRHGLRSAGVRLLVDAAAKLDTPAGPVEVLGFDFTWGERAKHLAGVCEAHPRTPGVLRVALLHDPGAFRHLPPGAADLVLSGHTHGGQLGLLRLGLPHTIVSALTSIPDHGLWARGVDRLYVHRGTGHYGFPLRIGVPAEHSLLRVHAAGMAP